MLSRKTKVGLTVVLATVLLSCVGAEVAFRLAAPEMGVSLEKLRSARRYFLTGEGQYTAHPYLALARHKTDLWKRETGLMDELRGVRTDRQRVLCLGGSTTEGGNDRRHQGSYPFFLGHLLLERHGTLVEVMNGGTSGWTTMESMIAYFIDYHEFQPDVVLIHHAVNDVDAIVSPGFRSDYSHWRTNIRKVRPSWWERPLLRCSLLYTHLARPEVTANSIALATDRPTPEQRGSHDFALHEEGDRVFRRNVELIGDHAAARGAKVGLLTLPYVVRGKRSVYQDGMDRNNQLLRDIAAEKGWLLVDLDRRFREDWTLEQREETFLDGVHLKPAGNRAKAQYVAEALLASGAIRTD